MMLIDLFPSWMAGKGIFSELGEWAPWAGDESIDINSLDIEYFGNRSGYKETSPLLDKLAGFPSQIPLSDVQIQRIVSVIKSKYALSWGKMWEAINAEYNPLENYSMTEKGLDEAEAKETKDMTKGTKEESSTNSRITTSADAKNKVIPFGSTSEVETDASESESVTQGTKENNYGEVKISGKDTDVTERKDKRNHDFSRSGNIGVTTSQQMLTSELELRRKHYFDFVFDDMDAILTAPIWTT